MQVSARGFKSQVLEQHGGLIMEETTRSNAARLAIHNFRIAADALLLIGRFHMNTRSGQVLQDALKTLSPEIYGTMNDPRSIELKGLEYVMERLPRGVEECSRFVMTSEEDLGDNSLCDAAAAQTQENLVPYQRKGNVLCDHPWI